MTGSCGPTSPQAGLCRRSVLRGLAGATALTAEATRRAVETYDGIVARGGWPQVSKVLELRRGTRHESVVELRERLAISGDLDPNARAVENDIYDSYLEEAVRRFQARHGLTIDGIVHEATFDAMNVPARSE